MTRLIALASLALLVLGACGDPESMPDGTGGSAGSGGSGGSGGSAGSGGISGSSGVPVPGTPCGPPLSAPTEYGTPEELEALVVGMWIFCEPPGLFTDEAIGIEFRADRTWVELFDVDGTVVRSEYERDWSTLEGRDGPVLVLHSGGMNLFRPLFFEAEDQMELRDRRLRRIDAS